MPMYSVGIYAYAYYMCVCIMHSVGVYAYVYCMCVCLCIV